MSPAEPSYSSTRLILSLVIFSFISFISIGIPLAALPGYVHDGLGYGTTLAGIVIGIQYLATLLFRPMSGRLADGLGAKKTVLIGMLSCMASGTLLMLAAWLHAWPAASIAVMLASRLLLGLTQSLIGISAISWGINKLGPEHTARMISWNGIAAYGGVGIGAPLGVLLHDLFGLWSLGAVTLLLALTGLGLAWRKPPAPVVSGARLPFAQVLRKVAPHGLGLALGTIGYGTLSAFIALYYAERGWEGAAWCLTLYAATFIGTRLLLPNLIGRWGGYPVAMLCLTVEMAGMLIIWLGDSPAAALAGSALAGCGLSLLYPALGIEVIPQVGVANRSSGLSVFAMFFDLALGLSGPAMGVLAGWFGLRDLFLVAALLGGAGLLVTAALRARQRREADAGSG